MDVKYPERVLELMNFVRDRILQQLEGVPLPDRETMDNIADEYLTNLKTSRGFAGPIDVRVQMIDGYRIFFHRRGALLVTMSEGIKVEGFFCRSARHAKRMFKRNHEHTMVVNYTATPMYAAPKIYIDPPTEKPDVTDDLG